MLSSINSKEEKKKKETKQHLWHIANRQTTETQKERI